MTTRPEDDAFAASFRAAFEPQAREAIDSATKPYREMVKALAITLIIVSLALVATCAILVVTR